MRTWPTFSDVLFRLFRVWIAAAVVLNLVAIVARVSPFFTVYVVRNDAPGDVLGDREAAGIEARMDAVGNGDPDGRIAMSDADAEVPGPVDPADRRVNATNANAITISPTRAS